ncbi:5-methyltetrahydropteroyltriglutamate--homocysteine methyltransferase [Paenibacillus yonginensis]|uniref:5-methyltetrahydropteroyltriglutamate--homocysteine methyltransferase n=1 Tax=Paenibacillus yonginensis TaxID=1462996 RepID=A0A1B1N3D8_9BACL|nr:cobalamin-independent methionine synthase II family protein [Paenibacillus yonginensis]ANS75944.1 5-methyltetrahydropteroyltriglutamate--homocysteine methyltransferase [Paenibacillus yonginensis]
MCNRFQIVGSLLRPSNLLEYKHQIEHRDDIRYPFYQDFQGYEQCESEAIQAVVDQEIKNGLSVLTDGEYSKSMWHLDFVWGFQGISRYIADHGYFFRDIDGTSKYETRKDIGLRITGELGGKNHHFIDVFKKLQTLAGERETKLCVPSPSHIFGELSWSDNIGGTEAVYKDKQELKAGLVKAYKEFVEDFAAAGGKILQFDDCLWELFADDNPNSPYTGEHINQEEVQALAAEFIDINNTIIDFGHGLGLKMWTHNCRGNYDSRNMGGGSYAKIANLFLKQLKYDRFFLEWDDERAGSLEALAVFKDRPETEIVLGLLSSKTNTLDDETRVIRMLDEASKIIDKDRLLLSHQCGFASCDGGNELTEEEQWAKIKQGQRIAEQYWGN